MRALPAAVLALAALSAAAPAAQAQIESEIERGTFTLEIENDYFGFSGADRHYTTGTRLSWLSAPTERERTPTWTSGPYTAWPIFAAEGKRRWGFAIGQNIYTPTDVDRNVPDPNDRPYAGWTYLAVSFNTETETRIDTLELDIGIVGPAAGARAMQNNFHHLIGTPESRGWDHQLKNEPAAMLVGERRWRVLEPMALFGTTSGLNTDIIGIVGASLGNVQTYGSAGVIFRIGGNLLADFGPPHIRPSLPGSGTFNPTEGFNWYLFGGLEGRAVAHDIFLDGNTFRDSPSVDKKHFVGDFSVGIAATYGSVRASFTQIYRTKEFDGQQGDDRFGAFSLSWRF